MTAVTASTGLGARLGAYVALTKPRIVELLLITTVPAMILAAGEWPGTVLVVATVGGGALSAGGANALNNAVDRDIDAAMVRTRRRPVPAQRIPLTAAVIFGLTLGAAGFAVLWVWATPEAALLATGALAFYVLVYTLMLKRTTVHNIVIGGAAGALPAVIGWAAVTGDAGALPAWALFAVVFAWTPPHFWALSLRFRDDYARAGVPMLPVVAGEKITHSQIVVYSVAVTAATVLAGPLSGLGWIYLGASAVLGGALVLRALGLTSGAVRPLAFFRFSNVYLALVFGAVAVDVLVDGPAPGETTGLAITAGAAAVLVVAAVGIAVTLRPGPRSAIEWLWLAAPVVGAGALAWAALAAVA
jgi:protoheme IX farnesyltransferase